MSVMPIVPANARANLNEFSPAAGLVISQDDNDDNDNVDDDSHDHNIHDHDDHDVHQHDGPRLWPARAGDGALRPRHRGRHRP